MEHLTRVEPASPKTAFYEKLCEQLSLLLGNETNLIANAANTSAFLFELLPDINWVGFYFVEGRDLVVGPFQGKAACARIPFGQGVCGTAAESKESIVVPNVHEFEGHIACDTNSQSEIVVPLLNWGRLIGVLDVDSPSLGRFDQEDCEGLESLASVFLATVSTNDLPDFSDEAAES